MASHDDEIAADVNRFGWSCLAVHDADPPFAYTVGLMHTYDHPELILVGRTEDDALILADLVTAIREGERIDEACEYDLLRGFPIATRPVHETHHEFRLGFATGFLRSIGRVGELEAVQVFVPDVDGRYPFEFDGTPSVQRSQPRLDVPRTATEVDER